MKVVLFACLALAVLAAPTAPALAAPILTAQAAKLPGMCPDSRAYLEPRLKTTPDDGSYFSLQREAIEMPIDEVIEMMGGMERAYAIAFATRQAAEDLLHAEVNESERHHLDDTILRADALISILECRRTASEA